MVTGPKKPNTRMFKKIGQREYARGWKALQMLRNEYGDVSDDELLMFCLVMMLPANRRSRFRHGSVGEKTLADCSPDEIGELAEASHDLLNASRIQFWIKSRCEVAPGDDPSLRDSIERMASALNLVGLPVSPTAEFVSNLEDLLKSGLPPEEWKKSRGLR